MSTNPAVAHLVEDHTTIQLAMFMQARDTKMHGATVDGVLVPSWTEAGPVAQEEYLRDAQAILAALRILGWGALT